jgi:signal transduction histidine kinase
VGIELLSSSDTLPAAFGELRTMMQRQINQLVRLVEDLGDVSGISRGNIQLTLAPVDLADAIEAAAEQVADKVHKHQHDLVIEFSGRCTVRGDLGRLTQVFANLLVNAVKYTPDGGLIRIRTETTADHVRTRVTDTGLGFPPERVGALFKMFSRLPEHRRCGADGLGVGLALSAGLIGLHGGTIEACSAGLGRGSEFTVCLPRAAKDSRSESQRKDPTDKSRSRSRDLSNEARALHIT